MGRHVQESVRRTDAYAIVKISPALSSTGFIEGDIGAEGIRSRLGGCGCWGLCWDDGSPAVVQGNDVERGRHDDLAWEIAV